jgi:hypothetical protein
VQVILGAEGVSIFQAPLQPPVPLIFTLLFVVSSIGKYV